MEKVLPLLRKEVEVGKLQKELTGEVNRKIGERQREFFLKEQLKIIQRELGITRTTKAPTPTSSARARKARWCHRPRRSASTRN